MRRRNPPSRWTSVLGRYLWTFRRIVGQMQHDLFHVYTVDQHILMVLRNVRRFFIPEHAHEYPFCSQLAAGWDKPYILYVGGVLFPGPIIEAEYCRRWIGAVRASDEPALREASILIRPHPKKVDEWRTEF